MEILQEQWAIVACPLRFVWMGIWSTIASGVKGIFRRVVLIVNVATVQITVLFSVCWGIRHVFLFLLLGERVKNDDKAGCSPRDWDGRI